MSSKSSKSIEKKLERKRAELKAATESRQKLDEKIRKLREEIENLQSAEIEHIFQRVKKSILKEGLHVDADAAGNILQTIRDNQGQDNLSNIQKKEMSNNEESSGKLDEDVLYKNSKNEENESVASNYAVSHLP